MNTKRLFLATLAIWLFGTVYAMLTCGWLFNWVYQIPPIIWKTPAEMMTASNMIGSNLSGIVVSFVFVLAYAMLYKGLPEKGVKKGMIYGFIAWLIGPLSGIITMPYYMTIASQVVGYWIINMIIIYLVMGALVGLIYKPLKK
ncbi:hypothetical protein ACFL6I_21465 [candidate division KSB1 bacterium]